MRLEMIKVFGVMTWPMGRVHSYAIPRKRRGDLKQAFGSKMKVHGRDAGGKVRVLGKGAGGKCQPCCVEFEPHCLDA